MEFQSYLKLSFFFISTWILFLKVTITCAHLISAQITSNTFLNKSLFMNVILAPSTTSQKCRQDAQRSVRAGIELESRYDGSDNDKCVTICFHIRYTCFSW